MRLSRSRNVTSALIVDGAVTAADIGDDAVGNAELGPAAMKSLIFEYDFADLGGSVGAITLTDTADAAQTIPDNAVIANVWIEAITTATSGGSATIALGYTANTDAFLPATAYNNGEFTAEAATIAETELPLKMSAAVSVIATVAGAALTAGKFRVHVDYKEGA